jgi:hypothetical protein
VNLINNLNVVPRLRILGAISPLFHTPGGWSFGTGTLKWIQVDVQPILLGTVVIVDVANLGNVGSVICRYKAIRSSTPHLLPQPDLFFTNAKEQ